MPREINAKFDALFVEGPDDGVVVNALVRKATGIDLAKEPYRLVRVADEGGGDSWALRKFDSFIETRQSAARIGVVVDRDRDDNDKWPAVRDRLRRLGLAADEPMATGAIFDGWCGIWMWPDNVSHGDLEDFVAGVVPQSPVLNYASEVCRVAKDSHGAEYELRHSRKAALKVRSIWCDARVAGGYGHLVHKLTLSESAAASAFVSWFRELFLT